jgi:copper(I)-binding protein
MAKAEPLPAPQIAMHDTRNSGVAIGLARSTIIGAESGDGPAGKADYRIGSLVVTEPWSRPTPGGARLTAGYLRIVNTGTEPDRLIGGSARIADQLELHGSEIDDGISRMRPLREGIEIPAGATIELRPGGKHLMFAHLRNAVAQGERFEATLVFEKAGPLVVEFSVRNHAGDAGPEP